MKIIEYNLRLSVAFVSVLFFFLSSSASALECTESYCIDGTNLIYGISTYQRYDGVYRPISEANINTGQWPYLIVDGGNYYTVTSAGVTFKLPKKKWIHYDFYMDEIKETLTVDTLSQLQTISVPVDASIRYIPLDFAPSCNTIQEGKNILKLGRFKTKDFWIRDNGTEALNFTDQEYYDVENHYDLRVVGGEIRLYFDDLKWFVNAKYPLTIDPTWTLGNSSGENTWGNTTTSDIKQHNDYSLMIENNITDYVSYWDFDSNNGHEIKAYDLNLTNGNNGTLHNMDTGFNTGSGHTTSGRIGSALDFDGVDDFVSLGVPSFDDINYTGFTFEGWVKPNSYTTGADAVFSYGRVDDVNSTHAFAWGGGQVWRASIRGDGWSTEKTMGYVDIGNWQYIAYTFDNGNLTTYYNGVVNTSFMTSTSFRLKLAGGRACRFGADGSGLAGWYFNGTIDEVRIYNRALSAEEIQTSYNRSYRPTGNITSQTLDAEIIGNATDTWQKVSYQGDVPSNTAVAIYINTSTGFELLQSNALPDTNYTLTNMTQYIQWRLELTGNRTVSPRIYNVSMTSYTPPPPPQESVLTDEELAFLTEMHAYSRQQQINEQALNGLLTALLIFIIGIVAFFISYFREEAIIWPFLSVVMFLIGIIYSYSIPFSVDASGAVIGTAANVVLSGVNMMFAFIALLKAIFMGFSSFKR